MDRADMGGRTGDVNQPVCNKCRGPMLFQGSDTNMKCPNCDMKSATRSGVVNMTPDPGEGKEMTKGPVNIIKTKVTDATNMPPLLEGSSAPKTSAFTIDGVFDQVDNTLSSTKFDSVNQAKKILNLRKKLHNLKFEIKTFLEGGK